MALVLENRRKARTRLVRKTLLSVAAVILCLILTYTAFRRWTLTSPPDDEGGALAVTPKIEQVDGGRLRLSVGKSWIERVDGIWRLDLEGDPRRMGHAHGLLARRLSDRFEQHMHRLLHGYVPSGFKRWLMGNLIRWRYRHLSEWIPPRRLVELAALSRTLADTDDYAEQPFQRLVYYHAMYDITQQVEHSPLISCTAFAAGPSQTVNKHLLVGRNFDFDAGEIFDRDKALIVFRTPGRIPVASVAWPGMTGVVTGINAKRLYVSLNAARTDDPLRDGTPAVFLVRAILERADSVKAAVALLKKQQPMGAQSLLIASGAGRGTAAVVELSSARIAVRWLEDGMLGVTNHFIHRKYRGDANNDRLRRESTSDARYKRLMQLLRRFRGRVDHQTAALVLRNRTAVDDEPLTLGHRRAIDALSTTHSVVVDLTDLRLWVSRGPSLLGAYVPVDLKPMFGIAPPRKPKAAVDEPAGGRAAVADGAIPADPLLGTARLERLLLARRQMQHARLLRRVEAWTAAVDLARRAVGGVPKLPEARKLLGDLLWERGERQEARRHYKRFLELKPPYRAEAVQVKARLGEQ